MDLQKRITFLTNLTSGQIGDNVWDLTSWLLPYIELKSTLDRSFPTQRVQTAGLIARWSKSQKDALAQLKLVRSALKEGDSQGLGVKSFKSHIKGLVNGLGPLYAAHDFWVTHECWGFRVTPLLGMQNFNEAMGAYDNYYFELSRQIHIYPPEDFSQNFWRFTPSGMKSIHILPDDYALQLRGTEPFEVIHNWVDPLKDDEVVKWRITEQFREETYRSEIFAKVSGRKVKA